MYYQKIVLLLLSINSKIISGGENMNEYEKPYKILFNAVTDAIKTRDFETAKGILILAQVEAEEAFVNFEENEPQDKNKK